MLFPGKGDFITCCFSGDNKWLVTAATEPESSIVVWNWEKEKVSRYQLFAWSALVRELSRCPGKREGHRLTTRSPEQTNTKARFCSTETLGRHNWESELVNTRRRAICSKHQKELVDGRAEDEESYWLVSFSMWRRLVLRVETSPPSCASRNVRSSIENDA